MNGIVLLDKPTGMTSFEAVRAVSRIYDREKAGHAGTLDPAASGVLPIFLGRATKLISLLPDSDKAYVARVRLGAATDTGDAEGTVTATADRIPGEQAIRDILPGFLGETLQIPPMYSAKKQNGVPLYKLAREGVTAQREACRIRIDALELSDFRDGSFDLSVRCSSGTYIRTLAEDIAKAAGTLAHLTALRRTAACGIGIERCFTLDQLRQLKEEGRAAEAVTDCESPFLVWPRAELQGDLTRLFLNGFRFPASRAGIRETPGTRLRICLDGRFAALGEISGTGELCKLWQAETIETKGTSS